MENDVSLLRLEKPAELNENVALIRLPPMMREDSGEFKIRNER